MKNEAALTKEKLTAQMKTVLANTEELLNATSGEAGDVIKSIRSRVEEALRSARIDLRSFEHDVIEKAGAAAEETDKYVHNNPWLAIGTAAGLGLIIGIIIGRK